MSDTSKALLRIVCAWCGRVPDLLCFACGDCGMRFNKRLTTCPANNCAVWFAHEGVSYGICEPCKARVIAAKVSNLSLDKSREGA